MKRASKRAYVGLGANLKNPVRQLQLAVASLAQLPRTHLVTVSSFYSNPSMPPGQPDYVNAVAVLETALSPHALLVELHTIEFGRGRRRDGTHWGPRVLDLDLLLVGDLQVATARLTLPHPGIAERAFVLVPLAELEPALQLPDGRAIVALRNNVATHRLYRLTASCGAAGTGA